MIVVETLLRDLFSQLPDVNITGKDYPVKFGWGDMDDCNLYLKNEAGNTTPLIWLEQGKDNVKQNEVTRRTKLILAVNSAHRTNQNPKVWDTEFTEVLNPLLDKVLRCLNQSQRTFILNNEYAAEREANYSQSEMDGETPIIDCWNVIIFEATVVYTEGCLNTINFN